MNAPIKVNKRLRRALKIPLLPFQRTAVRFLEKCKGRALCCDDMGLGKTAVAIAWAAINPEARPIIVVCPASVKWHWQREFERFAGMSSYVCEGMSPSKEQRRAARKADVVIINYDIVNRSRKIKRGPRKGKQTRTWLPTLLKKRAKLVIYDECHYLRNRTAKRTKACKEISKGCKHILPLSGTPIEGKPGEFFPVLNMVRPKEFPSFWKYAFEYCAPTRRPWGGGWDFSGASNLDSLHSRLKRFMIRRMKRDVWKQMPRKVRTVLPIELQNREDYEEAEENFLSWLKEKKGLGAFKRALRAQAVVKVGALKMLAAEGKMRYAIDWIREWLETTDEKLIVFAEHKKILKRLRRKFPKALVIDGSVSNKANKDGSPSDRQEMVDKFQKSKKHRLLFGQRKAAGQGLTLTAGSNVLFLELGWTPGEHEQAEDRVLRIGQTKQVNIYYLVGRDTIEERILQVLDLKSKTTNRILDGKKRATMRLLDLMLKEAA